MHSSLCKCHYNRLYELNYLWLGIEIRYLGNYTLSSHAHSLHERREAFYRPVYAIFGKVAIV